MDVFKLHRGSAPLLISLPHDGSAIPDAISARLTDGARSAPDTDWFVSRLYDFARDLGASVLVPTYSRYVVDLNRSSDDVSLYPGQNTTGLCPIVRFSGEPVYREGEQPTPTEIAERVQRYWQPYHQALAGEIERIRSEHGRVLLWEGHSIRAELPFLFEGRLPDFNLGTVGGNSCAPAMQQRIAAVLSEQGDYTWVANGRFKGGYITRHYGDPTRGVDAVQLELAQSTYMDDVAVTYDDDKAAATATMIRKLLAAALAN
ncbi:MAG TPA: N-formylglutamate deformylase [Arenimonas sp.]|uniref:N-formylglutamate deformylase n=1 Tax=Arenimonas sp. TaxID=1872635 RepID=UPI002C88CEB3|nr:N-formylglutamate deformylase [Arenimonas sp.]HMB55659.1 N-formylglutamate deformylase [Arenimonas sp.]